MDPFLGHYSELLNDTSMADDDDSMERTDRMSSSEHRHHGKLSEGVFKP